MRRIAEWVVIGLLATAGVRADDLIVREGVQALVEACQARDATAVTACVHYPLRRWYPLTAVETAAAMEARFAEVFDDELLKLIAESDFAKDWEQVGWRGYMLDHGTVWVDYDGKVWRINHASAAEQTARERLIEEDRAALHSSLRTFEEPLLKWETAHWRLRVDDLGGPGPGKDYRLAIWARENDFKTAPQRVVDGGTLVFEGSGGNHFYRFEADGLVYQCDVEVLGGESEYGIGTFLILDTEPQKPVVEEEAIRSF